MIQRPPKSTQVFKLIPNTNNYITTKRTGFVVLHPLEGVAGEPLTVEHVDGRVVQSRFPAQIDPACPFMNIRALTHEVAPGLQLTCRMEGDTFEMEDHRNWMDASYKTYVRPLAQPWPYTLPKGEHFEQRVTLTFHGQHRPSGRAAGGEGVEIAIGGEAGDMPRIGLAVPGEAAADATRNAALLKAARPSFLVCHFDPRLGHDRKVMQAFQKLGTEVGCPLVLEAVAPCVDQAGQPSGDLAILARDVGLIRDAARGIAFERVMVSPAADLKCTLPGSVWPPSPSWAELFTAVREAFPGIPVGGGMMSYFTELNRKRPPAELLEFVAHTGCPLVHAGDDLSMTETLEALPWQFASTRSFCPGKPYWVFPTAVSMRDNPYGQAPAENPANIRQAMNRVDPRDRALIGAAWYAGYLARAAQKGPDAVTLAAVGGPSAIVGEGGAVSPSYHVLKGAMALAGGKVQQVTSSAPRDVQALAVRTFEGLRVWITNLTGRPQQVRLTGIGGEGTLRVMDGATVAGLCADPASWAGAGRKGAIDRLELAPYAVVAIEA
jgi:hypothetical protein